MRNSLLKAASALLCLIPLFQLAVGAVPGSALAQPARPTLTATNPPAPTHKPDRNPTETPVPAPTELPTATAALAPTDAPPPTSIPAPVPVELPTTGAGSADWSAALLLALLLLVAGAVLRLRRR